MAAQPVASNEIWISLTSEEAWELLTRSLTSSEPDNAVVMAAQRKLAAAIQSDPEQARATLRLDGSGGDSVSRCC